MSPELSDEQRNKLSELLRKFSGLFTKTDKSTAAKTNVKHRIFTGDHAPINQRAYRVSPTERRIIHEEIQKMLDEGIVQPSESPWSSPIVLVRKKKDGSWRFCVDYRKLNSVTKKDVYPLPRIDDTLDCLKGAMFFSSMDLRSGYWQIEIDEADREKTAFITPEGLYEFKVMPFGLCNAPATFERMMDNLLRHFKWTMCLCYLDDIIVFSETFEDHLIRLRLVLKCLQEAGLKLNSKKCLFAAQEVKILGHLVSSNGVRPDPDKIKAVRNFPTPKNIHDIRSFLGLCSYFFRRFIKGFCYLAEPLQSLLKSGVEFHWGPEEVEAFNSLKKALTSDPVLGMYDERASTEIHTDASGYGIGAVLVQIQNNVEKVIAYASRTLTKAEKNYSTTERECLAIVWATNKFRPYIFGKHFTVVTDHHSLCWLMNLKDPSGRLARWALRLQEHDFDVKYKTGKKHSDADALSRNPVEEETETSDKFLAVTSMNLAMEQKKKKDQDLAKLKLLSNSSKNEEFRFIDGILCRKNFDPDGKLWLPVIPKHLRADILRHFHDAPTAGHLGFAKNL
ncbi:retrovirus-related Pol polyprotein from transposon 297 [Trichonephila clavipes]|nr:retrovirus-related Pol polyprotein from transposon 297 [Trichonephila clavipes]